MKRDTARKLKFRKLALALGGLREWQVKGLLQSLWDFAAENCPAGDIGRYSNADVALGLDWTGDADSLLDALRETHWIDVLGDRYVIHDWPEHCEEAVHAKLARAMERFADGSIPRAWKLNGDEKSRYSEWVKMGAPCTRTRLPAEVCQTPDIPPAYPRHTPAGPPAEVQPFPSPPSPTPPFPSSEPATVSPPKQSATAHVAIQHVEGVYSEWAKARGPADPTKPWTFRLPPQWHNRIADDAATMAEAILCLTVADFDKAWASCPNPAKWGWGWLRQILTNPKAEKPPDALQQLHNEMHDRKIAAMKAAGL